MNKLTELRMKGEKLALERLDFPQPYLINPWPMLHAGMDGHSFLINYSACSPRLFFTSDKGSRGKSTACYVSWFFTNAPLINTGSGAGVVRKINDLIAGSDSVR